MFFGKNGFPLLWGKKIFNCNPLASQQNCLNTEQKKTETCQTKTVPAVEFQGDGWMECQLLWTCSKISWWFHYLDFRFLWWSFTGHPVFSWKLNVLENGASPVFTWGIGVAGRVDHSCGIFGCGSPRPEGVRLWALVCSDSDEERDFKQSCLIKGGCSDSSFSTSSLNLHIVFVYWSWKLLLRAGSGKSSLQEYWIALDRMDEDREFILRFASSSLPDGSIWALSVRLPL